MFKIAYKEVKTITKDFRPPEAIDFSFSVKNYIYRYMTFSIILAVFVGKPEKLFIVVPYLLWDMEILHK